MEPKFWLHNIYKNSGLAVFGVAFSFHGRLKWKNCMLIERESMDESSTYHPPFCQKISASKILSATKTTACQPMCPTSLQSHSLNLTRSENSLFWSLRRKFKTLFFSETMAVFIYTSKILYFTKSPLNHFAFICLWFYESENANSFFQRH